MTLDREVNAMSGGERDVASHDREASAMGARISKVATFGFTVATLLAAVTVGCEWAHSDNPPVYEAAMVLMLAAAALLFGLVYGLTRGSLPQDERPLEPVSPRH